MQQGFYWVQLSEEEPEVWFYSGTDAEGWFEPTHNESISPQDFTARGYKIVSERLSMPK